MGRGKAKRLTVRVQMTTSRRTGRDMFGFVIEGEDERGPYCYVSPYRWASYASAKNAGMLQLGRR